MRASRRAAALVPDFLFGAVVAAPATKAQQIPGVTLPGEGSVGLDSQVTQHAAGPGAQVGRAWALLSKMWTPPQIRAQTGGDAA